MTDFQRVEIALRRAAAWYSTGGNHDSDLIASAFEIVANEIARMIKEHEGYE